MPKIKKTPSKVAIEREMSISIAKAVKRGRVSVADELMGYRLASAKTAETYANITGEPVMKNGIESPEILVGLVTDRMA